MSITEFKVQGRGSFPLDMLRYDACWPVDGDSAVSLGHIGPGLDEVRDVCLRSCRKGVPTAGRWISFGWSVVRDSIRKV